MRNGTQEELDAAFEDMTLIPIGTIWRINQDIPNAFREGEIVYRKQVEVGDDERSIGLRFMDGSDFWYVDAQDLEVINDN
jgi:hypothetical protein